MSQKTYIIVYGEGGHQEEMKRLLSYGLFNSSDDIQVIAFTDSKAPIKGLISKNYSFREFRDKHSYFKTMMTFSWNAIRLVFITVRLLMKYDVKGGISTGPGLAIIPFIILKLFRVRTIAFESWAMFYRPSLSGKILYRIANMFFIQHKTLSDFYRKAKFMGRL